MICSSPSFTPDSLDSLRAAPPARPSKRHPNAIVMAVGALLLTASLPARALDGCLVLLCLAAPSWRAIPQCVPPITQLWRDLARGKVFPSCGMSGGASTASHAWASAPSHCPPQYTWLAEKPDGPRYYCDYAGAVSVTVNGALFARTWWSIGGDAVTEFSASAKGQLGSWDTRFDDDYAAWLAAQSSAALVEPGH